MCCEEEGDEVEPAAPRVRRDEAAAAAKLEMSM
jgi:hypothetical protein